MTADEKSPTVEDVTTFFNAFGAAWLAAAESLAEKFNKFAAAATKDWGDAS